MNGHFYIEYFQSLSTNMPIEKTSYGAMMVAILAAVMDLQMEKVVKATKG